MPVKAKEVLRILERNGWVLQRIAGSHFILTKPGHALISLPIHGGRDLSKPLLQSILKKAGLKET